jgi:AcrR family transcriptional regulator
MPSHPPRHPDRVATEAALQKAALALVERNGVLAGLNLREVAEEAGVNRGLVYHYFGSRRDLLRAALRADAQQRLGDSAPGFGLPAAARYSRFLRTFVGHRRAAMLADGVLPADIDTDALHVAMSALVYGYLVFRERFAGELGSDPPDLDERVAQAIERMIRGLVSI